MSESTIFKLHNVTASLDIDSFGGAITSFVLHNTNVNPLSFRFTSEQMPENNKEGAVYQGHFACIGRWGEPSKGEVKRGLPNHGEPANIEWQVQEINEGSIQMQTIAAKEGLRVDRTVQLDQHNAVFAVKESVTNINVLGRPYNIVQHPTLAAPFLDDATIVDCNATKGFNQADYKAVSENTILWPGLINEQDSINLRNPISPDNSVYSFVVNPANQWGWVTAASPKHKLLIGYLWERQQYPWIHLWQHYNEGKIQYRGIEFGTAGIHKPFKEIIETATEIFGEKTYEYIDAGETISKSYLCFLQPINEGFTGIESVKLQSGKLITRTKEGDETVLQLSQNLMDELYE